MESIEFELDEDLDLSDVDEGNELETSSSSDNINSIVENLNGLDNDIVLDLIRETNEVHKKEGINSSYSGSLKSEERVKDLLEDIEVPVEVKAETNNINNVLEISNYTEFLQLQSRLTGVPMEVLTKGLQIFEDEVQQKVESNEFDTHPTEDEEVEIDNDDSDDIIEFEEDVEVTDIVEPDEEILDLELDVTPLAEAHEAETPTLIDEEALTSLPDEDEAPILLPDDDDTEIEIELDQEGLIVDDSLEISSDIEDNLEISSEEIDEPLKVAPTDSVQFSSANKNKINSSKTYSLHTLDTGGNYNV